MTLKEKLQKIADASAKQIPEQWREIMHRTTAEVAASIKDRQIPKVGDLLPPFELLDSAGNKVSSAKLATDGPFVLSFFRGQW